MRLWFSHSICVKCCACPGKVMPGHTECRACHAKSSSQNWRSDAPKCSTAPVDPLRLRHLFWTCYKTFTFCLLLARCRIPCTCTQNHIWTFKSGCTVFNILTWKYASCHNGVHYFDIATSKSAPKLVCFVHFDLEMCSAPKQRALFLHRNFQKCSEREGGAFSFFTCKCASRHNGVQFSISHMARWLRTRRFSEPTFPPSGATNHWKNIVFRDFPTFSRTWIFFLPTLSDFFLALSLLSSLFSLLSSLSSLLSPRSSLLAPLSSPLSSFLFSSLLFSDSSHLCFSTWPYCRKFDF